VKAIIFDMDGVLINSMKYHIISWKNAFKLHELEPSNETLSLYEGMSFNETIKRISKEEGRNFSDSQRDEIYLEKKKILKKIFKLEVYEGVNEFLLFLKNKGIKLGVVTGANKEFADDIYEKNFKNIFDVEITGGDVIHGKPNSEPYKKALQLLNCEAKDVIVIENAPLGIKSAKDVGLIVYALETTLDKKHLKGADKIFENHKQLFDNIRRIL